VTGLYQRTPFLAVDCLCQDGFAQWDKRSNVTGPLRPEQEQCEILYQGLPLCHLLGMFLISQHRSGSNTLSQVGYEKMGAVLQFLPLPFLVVLCPPVLSLRHCTRLFFVFIFLFDCGLLRGVDVLSWHRSTRR
jgi:hypothetical protein